MEKGSVEVRSSGEGIEISKKEEKRWFEKKLWRRVFTVGCLLVLVQLIFAVYSLVSVLYVKGSNLNIGVITFFRGAISAVISIPMAYFFEGKFSFRNYDLRSFAYFILMGSFSAALNPIMYLEVIKITSGSYTSLLGQLIPVFSSILSLLFRVEPAPSIKKPETVLRLIGIFIAVTFASSIISLNFSSSESSLPWQRWVKGTCLGIFNNVAFCLYLVLQMKIFFCNPDHPLQKKPFTVNCLCMCYGSAAYTCGFIVYAILCYKDITLPPIIVLPILYSAVLNSAIAYGIIMFCIKHSSAMISSCLFSLQIVTSMILLNVFANDKMTVLQYFLSPGVVVGALILILSPILPGAYKTVRKKIFRSGSKKNDTSCAVEESSEDNI